MAGDVKQTRRRAIDLLDALRRDWVRIGYDLSAGDRADTQAHIRGSVEELAGLVHEMEEHQPHFPPKQSHSGML